MPAPSANTVSVLAADSGGVLRVVGTRVTLDSVVAAFRAGATAEEIAQQYPTLALADVYQVIAHYLKHAAEVEAYLAKQQTAAKAPRRKHEARFDPRGVRDRLLARRTPAKA